MKSHLALGGMDVDIDQGGIEFNEEAAERIAALHQHGVIALDEGEIESAVFDGASVHEEMLVVSSGTRHAGCADDAPNGDGLHAFDHAGLVDGAIVDLSCEIDWNHLDIARVERGKAVFEGADAILLCIQSLLRRACPLK